MEADLKPLTESTVGDVVCLPGGLELAGKQMLGDIEQVAVWRKRMIARGLRGVVAYVDGKSRGFAEFIPAEEAPAPILAPGAAVLLCYHWAGTDVDDPEHLVQEKELVRASLEAARDEGFSGMATLGWDHPSHFPIPLLLELGFREITRDGTIALLWYPFRNGLPVPRLAEARYVPQDLSEQGMLAVETAYSTRCPYCIRHITRLRGVTDRHPDRARIRLAVYPIDTHEQAMAVRASPCDWWWTRFNGQEVDNFLSEEALHDALTQHLIKVPGYSRSLPQSSTSRASSMASPDSDAPGRASSEGTASG